VRAFKDTARRLGLLQAYGHERRETLRREIKDTREAEGLRGSDLGAPKDHRPEGRNAHEGDTAPAFTGSLGVYDNNGYLLQFGRAMVPPTPA
jgi:hypothetical protein